MMTSWNETRQIEAHLFDIADTGSMLVFEARLMLDNNLADKVIWQQKAYDTIQQYGRRQLKKEIETIHQKLFTQPEHLSFSQKIRRLFSKQ
ncbi:hypothetical protein [Mucilaginibacter sp.]|uniref:hypothetical protein n=1 Tax=Mucilaginibacter sp. TaxID=1882438 RepID=UPI002639D7DC|nr:hypothetical protein [Mucilaginibacter sp.]MDB5030335.1 hypothetical protein [Mucilaginibacter sp.]